MSEALKFIPPRVPLLDARTGLISREWYLFFQGVFDRIGGSSGDGIADISDKLNAILATDRPPPVQALTTAIAELAAAINAQRRPQPRDPLQQIELRLSALERRLGGVDELRRLTDELRAAMLAA